MLRLLPLFAALLLAAGCGSGGAGGPRDAPAPADLAADALIALEGAGSAHYVLDVQATELRDEPGAQSFSLQAEGDASEEAVTAEGSVAFGDGSISGKLVARPHDFFLNVMGEWYGTDEFGLADAQEAGSSDDEADEFWRDLQTPEGIRRHFDTLFTGEVSESADGTWRFEGRLNAEGFADLTERYGAEPPTRRDRELLGQLADGTHVVLVVGRDDSLPRRLELRFEPPALDAEFDSSELEDLDAYEASFVLELSEFGKEVEAAPPADYRPFEELFSGFGS
jgi:hypothetical protein